MIMLTFVPAKHTSPSVCLIKIAVDIVGRWTLRSWFTSTLHDGDKMETSKFYELNSS